MFAYGGSSFWDPQTCLGSNDIYAFTLRPACFFSWFFLTYNSFFSYKSSFIIVMHFNTFLKFYFILSF
jgi:hypothetical protein